MRASMLKLSCPELQSECLSEVNVNTGRRGPFPHQAALLTEDLFHTKLTNREPFPHQAALLTEDLFHTKLTNRGPFPHQAYEYRVFSTPGLLKEDFSHTRLTNGGPFPHQYY